MSADLGNTFDVPAGEIFLWYAPSPHRSEVVPRKEVSFYFKRPWQESHWTLYYSCCAWKWMELPPGKGSIRPKAGELRVIQNADLVSITSHPKDVLTSEVDIKENPSVNLCKEVSVKQFPVFCKIDGGKAEENNVEPESIPKTDMMSADLGNISDVPAGEIFLWHVPWHYREPARCEVIPREEVSFYFKRPWDGSHWVLYYSCYAWKWMELPPGNLNIMPKVGELRVIQNADLISITTHPKHVLTSEVYIKENPSVNPCKEVSIKQFPVFCKIDGGKAEENKGELPRSEHRVRPGTKVKVLKTQTAAKAPRTSSSLPCRPLRRGDVIEVESVRRRGPQLCVYYKVALGSDDLDFLSLKDVEPEPIPKTDKKLLLTRDVLSCNLARSSRSSRRPNVPFRRREQPMTTLKRVLFGVLCVFALGTFIFGGDLWSYLGTATSEVREAARSNVPIDFEIERAKGMVADLVPEIKKNMDTIAREEVALERLDRNIEALEGRMGSAKGEILTLEADLSNQSSATRFTYCGKSYTRSQVEADLASRFERYQVDEATVTAQKQMKAVRQQSLITAKEKLQAYLGQKRRLEVQLEQLAARLKMIELAKTTSEFNFDSEGLGEAKDLIDQLQARLEVEERLVGQHTDMANDVVLSADDLGTAGITEKVADYFEEPVEAIELASTTKE